MSDKSLLLIDEIAGFTPEIGRLVSVMNYVRSTTLKAVKGLSTHELDHVHDALFLGVELRAVNDELTTAMTANRG